MLPRLRAILLFVVAAVAVGYAAQVGTSWPPGLQRVSDDSPPLSPAEALKRFAMPPGYRVELVASEPLVQDPVMIDWDGEGRMWVVEMPGYMPDINAKGEHDPIGKIVVLEDTNNDGRMDKRTVFQDGLVLARWLKVLGRGVLVAEPPNLWLFEDTNGDLRADRRELVTKEYGRREGNVEHNANSLLWALDNNIYTSEIDIDLRLKNGKFEVRKTLSRGQWGITQDDAGRIFRNTNESALHVDLVPARYYMRHPNLVRTRGSHESLNGPNGELNDVWPIRPTRGVNRGYQHGILRDDGTLAKYTSVCTPMVYRGDRLPSELYGNLLIVDPTVNLVSRIEKACAVGCRVRVMFADPDGEGVRERDVLEGFGGTLPARIRMAMTYMAGLNEIRGVQVRLHDVHLYHAAYRFDDEMIVTPHLMGAHGPQHPALQLRRLGPDGIFAGFADQFERVWRQAKEAGQPAAVTS